jgi:hypothetical protein
VDGTAGTLNANQWQSTSPQRKVAAMRWCTVWSDRVGPVIAVRVAVRLVVVESDAQDRRALSAGIALEFDAEHPADLAVRALAADDEDAGDLLDPGERLQRRPRCIG